MGSRAFGNSTGAAEQIDNDDVLRLVRLEGFLDAMQEFRDRRGNVVTIYAGGSRRITKALGRNVAAATRRVNPGHPVGAQRQSVSGEVGRVGGLLLPGAPRAALI